MLEQRVALLEKKISDLVSQNLDVQNLLLSEIKSLKANETVMHSIFRELLVGEKIPFLVNLRNNLTTVQTMTSEQSGISEDFKPYWNKAAETWAGWLLETIIDKMNDPANKLTAQSGEGE